jgi:aspartate carbamoyltransferase catalytic subunit
VLPGHLLSIDDLSLADVDQILALAEGLDRGHVAGAVPGRSVALLFLEPSLRTRVGYSLAASRLGWSHVLLDDVKHVAGMLRAESFEDTLATVSGMVDVAVARAPLDLRRGEVGAAARCPLINGGDLFEHPTQALVDLRAIEALRGPVPELRITVAGDPAGRVARSLLRLLARRCPAQLTVVAPERRPIPDDLLVDLGPGVRRQSSLSVDGTDVVYLAGLPEGVGDDRLSAEERRACALTPALAATLPPGAIVLSPMPVIDEIDVAVRSDPRVRVLDQSDLGVGVRAAVLHHVVEWAPSKVAALP